MKALGFWLAMVLLSSCARFSGAPDIYRSISSVDSQVNTLSLEDIQGEMRDKFQQIEYTTLAAYESLAQFDNHLDATPGPLEENPHYPALLAARSQIEELQDDILLLRDQFYHAAMNPRLAVEDRLKSIELIRATTPGFTTALDRLVLAKMLQDYAYFTRQMLLDLAKLEDETVRVAMEKLYNELNSAYGPLKEKESLDVDWRTITSKARAELKENPEWGLMRRSYEHLAQEMRTEILSVVRAKQIRAKFYPSSEKSGNIIGTEFPAKVWSLTYDDGPGPLTSKKVIDNLQKHGLKATFFQLTKNAKELPAVAKLIREAGMELASHSYTHRQMPKLSLEQRDWEISTAASELGDVHGRSMKLFRLPYGAGVSNPDIRARIAKANLIHVFWSVDTLDWMAQAPSEIVARTKKQMLASKNDAGVILFHDIHERTVVASEEIMRFLKQDARRVCPVEAVVEAVNSGAPPCP